MIDGGWGGELLEAYAVLVQGFFDFAQDTVNEIKKEVEE